MSHPVLSIGNIAAGGRAKTPLAGYVAARLRDMGERPAILSRGYGRRDPVDGVVVVRDPDRIRADLDRSGDEPLMLARQLDGVAVLVCPDRHLAGRLAEHHFGTTVHVLDDGFQHFQLHRDADIVVVGNDDVRISGGGPATLPTGHLREPPDAIEAADAVIELDRDGGRSFADRPQRVWHARRRQQPVRSADPASLPLLPSDGPVLAVAGIADPARFFADLKAAGWSIADDVRFRDHHRYSRADVFRIIDAMRACQARAVVTTEKDLVRLLPFRPFHVPVGFAPLTIEIEAADTFDAWLKERVCAARQSA